MKKSDILYDIDEEVFVYGTEPYQYKDKTYKGKIVAIYLYDHKIEYKITCKEGVIVKEQKEIYPLFRQGQRVKIKVQNYHTNKNDVEVIGEIENIDENEMFELKFTNDGKVISPCFKSDIIEYVYE